MSLAFAAELAADPAPVIVPPLAVPPLIVSHSSFVALLRQRVRQQPGGDIDDRDDTLVRHSGRTDDAEGPDAPPIDFVWRANHAALVERRQSRFSSDEQVHSLGELAEIEKMEQRCFLLEDLEQPAQPG